MSKILVTGVNGFVGRHLVRELHSRGDDVIGVGREATENKEISSLLNSYARCDLMDQSDVAALPLKELSTVINLAGLARVGDSFKNPGIYNQVNVKVLTILGDRLVEEKSHARMIAISTGAVYDPSAELPLTEDSGIALDNSPYALSKLLMEQAAAQLSKEGLDCIVVRPFNHIGPGQEPGFLVPDLYDKINKALQTGQPVEVGNLKTRRDYTDVRDVVKAYADLATTQGLLFDVYNVCSSKSIAGETILKIMLELMGATGKIETKVNPSFIRPSDPQDIYGSHERLTTETGWAPKFHLEDTLADFVNSKT